MFLRSDDDSIGNDELLWRRILNTPMWSARKEDGTLRLSSVAFLDNYTNEVSVNVASLTTRESVMANYPDMGLVSITAEVPRSLGHIVSATPEVEEVSHRVICPPPDISKSQRKTLASQMARAANWLINPELHRP